ncbi:MAG TPA: DNA translocase FtsK 4TM domain-containing protein [Anaerolineales bacterium]
MSSRTPSGSGHQDPAHSGNLLQQLSSFNLRFGRFARDTLGILLIVSALLALLASWGLAAGRLLSPLSDFLSVWLGWGRYLVIAAAAWAGGNLIRRHSWTVHWGQLLALELSALLALGMLALAGGNSLVRADAGMDGGRLGWGIAYLLNEYLGGIGGGILLGILFLVTLAAGTGILARLERWMMIQAGEMAPESSMTGDSNDDVEIAEPVPTPPAKKAIAKVPKEFRPAFLNAERKTAKSSRNVSREEGLPALQILSSEQSTRVEEKTINQTAGMIMKTLSEFGIPATVIGYRVGPAVTQFAVQPGFIKRPGANDDDDAQQMKVRVAQIANLQKDLALALSAERLRIEAPVPGKPYVGIEVPNPQASVVRLRAILESDAFRGSKSALTIALGRDVSGSPLIADLSRMPHLLIAGATGSGKSVCITALASCLAMNNRPEDLRMIMIDSKMVELLRFNGLAHLWGKVETDLNRIMGVLRWVVVEMEHRYRLLEAAHTRDLEAYNRKQARKERGAPLPRIVVLIDELADLMMSAPEQTEHNLVRLAQMARATGIHLVVATQRPSTDVVTGVIKANFPARVAFAVASGVDSRVILDAGGAETLLGRGDMLFLNPEIGNPIRAQGVMVTDTEIERIIEFWQKEAPTPAGQSAPWEQLLHEPEEDEDEGLLEQAISIVRNSGRASASMLQRRLRIGYPRAARLLDQLEEAGVVGPSQGGGREREILPDDEEQEESA